MLMAVAILGGLAAYLIGSEVHYAHSISPKGIATVRDFFDRFGEPQRVQIVERTVRIICQGLLQTSGRFRRRLLRIVIRHNS